MEKRTATETTKELIDHLNRFDTDEVAKEIFAVVSSSHRTLQANFFRAIQTVVNEYAKTEYFDPRNEKAVEYCKLVSESTKDSYIPFI